MSATADPFVALATSAPPRSIAIIGMPGAGKSSVGRKLAAQLAIPFFDADSEIEIAARMSVAQIFESFGEAEFRQGERRVIARLLEQPRHVLATGGGALLDLETRTLIKAKTISVWLRVDIGTLLERTSRRTDRPLLNHGDPHATLEKLLAEREPFYTEADIVIDGDGRPAEETAMRVMEALRALAQKTGSAGSHTGALRQS